MLYCHQFSQTRQGQGSGKQPPIVLITTAQINLVSAWGNPVVHCRLAQGKNAFSLCQAVNKAAAQMQPGAELDALSAWAWKFGMQFAGCMIKVCTVTCFAVLF